MILTWRDLRSYFKIDLSMIKKNIWIDPARREEHNGVKIIPLVVEKLLMKTLFTRKS